MRAKRLTTWLVLGVAVALAYAVRRRRGAPHRRAVPAAPSARPVGPWGVFVEATETRDTPVADHGAAGPRGL